MIKRYITLLFTFLCVFFSYTQVDYATEIQPIFDSNCIDCHSSPGASAGLILTSYEDLMAGGSGGSVIVLPNYEDSPLYERITGVGGYMPPSWYGDPLSVEEVGLMADWLNEGANLGGEDSPWDVEGTDCNMTIAIPADLPITFNGEPITDPIWIGVENPDGDVVGMTLEPYNIVDANNMAVWQAEGLVPGMTTGDPLVFVVNYNGEYGTAIVEYDLAFPDSTWSCNGLSAIISLDAIGEEQEEVAGCIEIGACNYNEDATEDDDSCIFPEDCETCSGETDGTGVVVDNDADADGICDEDEISGCTDGGVTEDGDGVEACNYNPDATDADDSCLYFDECGACGGDNSTCSGCMDPTACDYDPAATIPLDCVDYISCVGCIDVSACDYCFECTTDIYGDGAIDGDGISIAGTIFSCDYSCIGCGDDIGGFTYLGEYDENNYYISGDAYSWDDSDLIIQNYSGFYLATFTDEDEVEFLGNSLGTAGFNDDVWIGLYQNLGAIEYSEPDGGWEWITGEIFAPFAWGFDVEQAPNDEDGSENFGVYSVSNGGWLDVDGGDYFFIMECGALFVSEGCTDGTEDDGTPIACNYNPNAEEDDGSCLYVDGICETCEGGVIIDNDIDGDGICDSEEILGCTDELACNYNELATEGDDCIYINEADLCSVCSGETDGSGTIIDGDIDGDGICNEADPCPEDNPNDANGNGVFDCDEFAACTDPVACNYDPDANVDDGSCTYPGCTDLEACNFDPDAGCLLETDCIYGGCTNPASCNYDPDAPCDDGSCTSLAEDSSCVICTDPEAICNYIDPESFIGYYIENNATCNYDFCCDDPTATNYNPECECPDPDACFIMPDECNFGCDGVDFYPIEVAAVSYGNYDVSCFGASDGAIDIDFDIMNAFMSGAGPYEVLVYQLNVIGGEVDIDGDGFQDTYIGTITPETGPLGIMYDGTSITAGEYFMIAYDTNGCCSSLEFAKTEPEENTLSIGDIDPILCPGGTTNIDFTIEGDIGQFDVFLNSVIYEQSVQGGTITVESTDADGDGIPDDFTWLDPDFWPGGEAFYPDEYEDIMNECDGITNTIFVNIEGAPGIDNGDLIGAFYTTAEGTLQCFAYNEYSASFDGSSFFTIQICEGDDNGFYDGEEVVFLVYDVSGDAIYEIDVQYVYNNASGDFTDTFTTDLDTYSGIYIDSLWVIGESGFVPDFSLFDVGAGSYNIQVLSTFGENCIIADTTINLIDPDPIFLDVVVGGSVCNYLEGDDIVSTPEGYIELDNVIGGTAPYSYSWALDGVEIVNEIVGGVTTLEDFDGDGDLDDLDFVTAGLYTLTITDFNACDTVIDVLIEGSDIGLGDIDFDYNTIACLGGNTDITVSFETLPSETYTFSWQNSSGEILVFIDNFTGSVFLEDYGEGIYTAIITDSSGCSISESESLDINPDGQILINYPSVDLDCGSDEAFVDFANCDGELCILSGNDPFSYTWYMLVDANGDGDIDIEDPLEYIDMGYPSNATSVTLGFGSYSFYVTDDSGCTGYFPFELSAPVPPVFEAIVDSIECDGEFASISLELVEGNPGIYNFTFQDSTQVVNIGASSLEFLIDEDTNMFNSLFQTDGNQTLGFEDPSIFSIGDTIGVFYYGENGLTCGGSQIYNGEAVFSVAAWGSESGLNNGFEAGEEIQFFVGTDAGIYHINIIESDPDPEYISPEFYQTNGISIITVAELGDEFVEGPSFTTGPITSGFYSITVVDGNECSQTINEVIPGIPSYYYNTFITNPSCDGSSGQIVFDIFGGTPEVGGYSISWTGPDGEVTEETGSSLILSDLLVGEYSIDVIDANGCALEFDTILEIITSVPDIQVFDEVCEDDGIIEICVDWPGEISFSYQNDDINEIQLAFNDIGIFCYEFTDVPAGDLNFVEGISYDVSISASGGACSYDTTVFVNASDDVYSVHEVEDAYCPTGTGSISIVDYGGGNPPYVWNYNGLNAFANSVGSHEYSITDADGCETVYTYEILNETGIDSGLEATDYACFGDNSGSLFFDISGASGGPYTYSLSGPNSLIDTILIDGLYINTGYTNTVNGLSEGLYTLSIQDINSDCELVESIQINSLTPEILFDVISDGSVPAVFELDFIQEVSCPDSEASVFVNISDEDNSNFDYYWYQLTGDEQDIDNDGILDSDDFSIDNGVFIASGDGLDEVLLYPSFYYVYVENSLGCISDTVLFQVHSPDPFQITVNDIMLDCYGDITSVNPIVIGGSDWDIDNDEQPNEYDEFGEWIDDDIDGDGIDIDNDGDCDISCNDVGEGDMYDSDIDNDGILNDGPDGIPGTADDDVYIGGTNFNGISTDPDIEFDGELHFESVDNPGVEVDENSLSAGTYIVYSMDTNGCESNEELFVISEPDPLSISLQYSYNGIEPLVTIENTPIEILCHDDFVHIVANPIGGTFVDIESYNIVCVDDSGIEYDLTGTPPQMFYSGTYYVYFSDLMGCESDTTVFIIQDAPNELLLDAEGVVQYNEFHISCNGYNDGRIDFSIPLIDGEESGVGPYDVFLFYENSTDPLQIALDVPSDELQSFDDLFAGVYTIEVVDANGCLFFSSIIELIEPDIFEIGFEIAPPEYYIINASCDEESDGMVIIRTSGGNPYLTYTYNNNDSIHTTLNTTVVIYESVYNLGYDEFEEYGSLAQHTGSIFDEIILTESDILIQGLPANQYVTVQILNDEYGCIDGPINLPPIFVGSDDENCIFIPSVFTPNNDGFNDIWEMHNIDLYPEATITVFNRWGQIVFERKRDDPMYFGNEWDGFLDDNNQEIATYYYIVNLNANKENYTEFTGSVTIKR